MTDEPTTPELALLASGYTLTSARLEDRDDYVRLLDDGDVARFIPAIPRPYTAEIAEAWIRHRLAFTAEHGREICFSIRDPRGVLAGSVGVDDLPIGGADIGELGYWLGPAHRGRGVARQAVHAFIAYAFNRLALARLTAHTLDFNQPSIRLLVGAGFEPQDASPELVESERSHILTFTLPRTEWESRIGSLKARR